MPMAFMHVLLFLMLIGALVAVEARNLLSAVISVGAVGFMLSIVFLVLGAPDVAITQVVVEVLCLVILIKATINRDLTTVSGGRESFGMVVTIALVVVFSAICLTVLTDTLTFGSSVLDRFADAPSQTYLAEGLTQTGAANIVTAVLLDYRGYDTLGEATVLFCSILGALAILRGKARKRVQEADEEERG
jgi:multisubunit Na+/H+ antiporter MnhB subunit